MYNRNPRVGEEVSTGEPLTPRSGRGMEEIHRRAVLNPPGLQNLASFGHGAWASHCGDFSCCRERALGCTIVHWL